MMHHTQCRAEEAGRQARAHGQPLHAANPFGVRTKSFKAFQRGWFAEDRRIAKALSAEAAGPESAPTGSLTNQGSSQ